MAQDKTLTVNEVLDYLIPKRSLTDKEKALFDAAAKVNHSRFDSERQQAQKEFDELVLASSDVLKGMQQPQQQPMPQVQSQPQNSGAVGFNKAEYDKWLTATYGNKIPKDDVGVQAARMKYINEVLVPTGDVDSINAFIKAKPLSDENFAALETQLSTQPTNPTPSDNSQNVTSDAAVEVAAVSGANDSTGGTNTDIKKIIENARNRRQNAEMQGGLSKLKKEDVATGVTGGLGALKAITGAFSAKRASDTLKDLQMPKAPVYQPNQMLDTEIAKAQVLAETGDPTLLERGMRNIASEKAQADERARMASSGDVSALGAMTAGTNVAGMNAMRNLLGDVNAQKMGFRQNLQGLVGQKTQDNQFKQGADMQNFGFDMREYLRKGGRAENLLDAGVGNIVSGVQDITAGGVNLAGRSGALDKILAQFDTMSPEQQKAMIAKYPKLFATKANAMGGVPMPKIPNSIFAPKVTNPPINYSI